MRGVWYVVEDFWGFFVRECERFGFGSRYLKSSPVEMAMVDDSGGVDGSLAPRRFDATKAILCSY